MLNRIPPKMPASAYKTYQILAPISSHFRDATCEEVDCEAYRCGWRVRIEGLDPQLLHTARTSGRRFTELHVAENENWLVFEPGQRCFRSSQHKVPLEREGIYVVRDGDWRGNPRGTTPYRHKRPEDWVDDFANHQEKLDKEIGNG